MHINTIAHHELKTAGAWRVFAALDWKTRRQVLAVLDAYAAAASTESNGQAATAEQEVIRLTGSSLLGEVAVRSLRKWTTRVG
jgi:hypothetical protein